jgi:hypothetical protein
MQEWKRKALGILTLIPGVTWRHGAPPLVAEESISVRYVGENRRVATLEQERQAAMYFDRACEAQAKNSSIWYETKYKEKEEEDEAGKNTN